MNLRDLRYIVSVAKTKNFAAAAQASSVSQPTLSMQIKKLEDELGVQIFERSQKKFLITQVGKEILKKAEAVIKEADELKSIAKNFSDPYGGEFIIGAFPTLAPYFFPYTINQISEKFPNLKLLLVEEKTDNLVQKLKNGEIDAALLALPINLSEFDYIKIFEEEFLLAASKDHPLSNKTQIGYKDINGKELMLLDEGHCMRDQALEVCSITGASEQKTFRATSIETLKKLVGINCGITLIPQIAAEKNDKISYLKISNSPKREIGFFFRKGSSKPKLTKEIGNLLKSYKLLQK